LIRELRKRFEFMNVNIRIFTIRMVLGVFFRRMVISYASLYVLAVGGDKTQIGIVNSLLPLAGLLMFPISGFLTDRTERVKLIALAGYFSSLTMLFYIFAPSWEWIAMGALLQGFAVFQFPPSSAILADSMEPRFRGRATATMFTLASVFSMFSPYIAGIILEFYGINFGMKILYTLLGITLAINGILMHKFLRETSSFEKADTRFNILNILREVYAGIPELVGNMPRSVKAFGVLIGMSFIANAVAGPFWVVYVIEEVGLSKIDWGLILLVESIFKTARSFPCGVISPCRS
jgi:MFS family permease